MALGKDLVKSGVLRDREDEVRLVQPRVQLWTDSLRDGVQQSAVPEWAHSTVPKLA